MSDGGQSGKIALLVAIIGALGLIVAAVIQSGGGGGSGSEPINSSDSSDESEVDSSNSSSNGGSEPPDPEETEFIVEVRPSTDPLTEIETQVRIDDRHVATLYSYQGPHEVSSSQFSEGDHAYDLKSTGYASNGAAAWVYAGAGTISVEDGARFRVLFDESKQAVYLSPMN